MSKTIDEKVVSMQFDNSNFEKNVSNTMGTLDKLKQSLNFSGASKGLDNISSAAKNVDMSSLGKGVETVQAKFSALEVMAVTALANITNSAVNAAKKIAYEFAIQPITTGFSEYELKMGSIQTIMASTGESLAVVNGYLDELNTYSDKTIYSFSDMTSNIGKFTNAGVKLEDAVLAIKGISNEAAISGANANEASRAMYNFAQALSAGYVKLIDWKSIENANMATVAFKQQLIDTAVELGTLTETTDGYATSADTVITATSNFNDSLQDQWMTTDVLVSTLRDYADETTEIGKKAYAAAQDVKTFSMMMDTLKEAAQSGWAQTWEIVVGDFEKAKELWTDWSEKFGDMLGGSADNRNGILSAGLGSKWDQLISKITDAGVTADDFLIALNDTLTENEYDVAALTEQYGSLEKAFTSGGVSSDVLKLAVDKLGTSFSDLSLATDGLDWGSTGDGVRQIQRALVDLGYDLADYGELADGVDGIFGDLTQNAVAAFQAAHNLQSTGIIDDATLDALKEASAKTNDISLDVDNLIDSVTELGGRENLIDALNNAFSSLVFVLGRIKKAWNSVFYPGKSDEDIMSVKAERILRLTEIISDFSENVLSKLKANTGNLTRTFKGLFAILDIIRILAGGALHIVFKILSTVLEGFDLNILDVTASIGDAIVAFRDWIKEHSILLKVLDGVGTIIVSVIKVVRRLISQFKDLPIVATVIDNISSAFSDFWDYISVGLEKVGEFIDRLKEMDDITLEDVQALAKDFADDVLSYFSIIGTKFSDFWAKIIALKDKVLLYLDPIKDKFIGIKDAIIDFVSTFVSKIPEAWETLKQTFSSISLDKILNVVKAVFIIGILFQLYKALVNFANLPTKISKTFDGIRSVLSSLKGQVVADSFKAFAIGVGIIAASIFLLAQLDWEDAWKSALMVLGIVIVLAAVEAALTAVSGKFGEIKMGGLVFAMVGLAAGVLILVGALKKLTDVTWKDAINGLEILGAMLAGLTIAAGVLGAIGGKFQTKFAGIAVAFLGISAALSIMLSVLNKCKDIKLKDITEALKIIGIFSLDLLAMGTIISAVSKGANLFGAAALMLTFVASLWLMLKVLNAYSAFTWSDMSEGIDILASMGSVLLLIVSGLSLLSSVAGTGNLLGMAALMLALVFSLDILADVIQKYGELKWDNIKEGLGIMVIIALGLAIFCGAMNQISDSGSIKAMLSLTAALAVLMVAVVAFGILPTDVLLQGAIAVGALLLVLAGAIALAGKNTGSSIKNVIAMAIGIAAFTAAILFLKNVPADQLINSAVALGVLMMALGMAVALAGSTGSFGSSAGLALAAVGILALAAALYALQDIPFWSLMAGVLAIALALGALVAAAFGMESFAIGAGLLVSVLLSFSLLVVAVAAGAFIFAGALYVVGLAMPLIGEGLTAIGKGLSDFINYIANCSEKAAEFFNVMAILSGGLALFGSALIVVGLGVIVLGAGLAIVSIALIFAGLAALNFAIAIDVIGLALPLIAQGLSALGPAISTFVTESANCRDKTGDFVLTMLALCGGLTLFAIGIAVAAVGVVVLSIALVALAVSLAIVGLGIGVLGLGLAVVALAALIFAGALYAVGFALPLIGTGLTAVGEGLNNFITSVSGCKDSMDNFKTVISGVGDSTLGCLLKISGGVIVATIAIALLGVSFVVLGAGVIVAAAAILIFAIAMAAGLAIILAAFSGISDACSTVGTNIVQGISNGITSALSSIGDAIAGVVNSVVGGICELLGIHSPSTVMQAIGLFTGQGFALGLDDSKSDVETSAEELADTASTTLEGAGDEGGAAYTDGVLGGIDLGGSMPEGFDMSTLTNALGGAGGDGGTAFTDGAISNIDFSSLGSEGLDLSSLTSALGGAGEEGGTAYTDGVLEGVDFSSITSGSGFDFSSITSALSGAGGDGGTAFTEGFASTLSTSSVDMSGIIASCEDSKSEFRSLGGEMATEFSLGIQNNISDPVTSIGVIVDGMISAINDKQPTFGTQGKILMTNMVKGIQTVGQAIPSSFTSMLSGAVSGVKLYYSSFYTAGQYLGQGLIEGINSKWTAVYQSAFSLGQAAVQGEMDGQQSQSPSKAMIKAGHYFGEGLVIGIKQMTASVYKSSKSIGEEAVDGLTNAIAKVSDLIASGMEAQPTIRPVLDLSDVESGVGTIDGLLNANHSIGATAHIRAIGSMMSENQNGVNDDVISAIENLGRKIGAAAGNTYNVNGVTYDDGSNISDAVKTLIRAARIERRA